MDYKTKYLKYKVKYNKLLKEQHGGNKNKAKEIAAYVNATNPIERKNVNTNPIVKVLFDANTGGPVSIEESKAIIDCLFAIINGNSNTYKYLHNIIRKEINFIDDFSSKTYSFDSSCTTGSIKFKNFPDSGLDAINDKLMVNILPTLSQLPDESTYNYVLKYVTDLTNNQTYYYFIFAQYSTSLEYGIKHSNLRVFLPEEWSHYDSIDYGLIASGELKVSKATKQITFDFNSSSNIITMLEGKNYPPQSQTYKKFKETYLNNKDMEDLLKQTKTYVTNKGQLFSLVYLILLEHMVSKTLDKLISMDSSYNGFSTKLHSDYTNKNLLLDVAKNVESNIYYYGLFLDPYPKTLGGLHNYANKRCYTDDEIEKFNTNTISKYDDLDDTNISTELNCIKKNGIAIVNSGDSNKDKDFKALTNCN